MGKMKKIDNFLIPRGCWETGPLKQFCFLCEMLKPFGKVMWQYLLEFLKGTCLLIQAVHMLVVHPTEVKLRMSGCARKDFRVVQWRPDCLLSVPRSAHLGMCTCRSLCRACFFTWPKPSCPSISAPGACDCQA